MVVIMMAWVRVFDYCIRPLVSKALIIAHLELAQQPLESRRGCGCVGRVVDGRR